MNTDTLAGAGGRARTALSHGAGVTWGCLGFLPQAVIQDSVPLHGIIWLLLAGARLAKDVRHGIHVLQRPASAGAQAGPLTFLERTIDTIAKT